MSEPISDEEMLDVGADVIANHFHDTYERLAPEFGYDTRPGSAVVWADVPEANRNLMIATVRVVLAGQLTLLDAAVAERDRYRETLEHMGDLNMEDAHLALTLAYLALTDPAGGDGCTCRRTTYDEAYHVLHQAGCPALTDPEAS